MTNYFRKNKEPGKYLLFFIKFCLYSLKDNDTSTLGVLDAIQFFVEKISIFSSRKVEALSIDSIGFGCY